SILDRLSVIRVEDACGVLLRMVQVRSIGSADGSIVLVGKELEVLWVVRGEEELAVVPERVGKVGVFAGGWGCEGSPGEVYRIIVMLVNVGFRGPKNWMPFHPRIRAASEFVFARQYETFLVEGAVLGLMIGQIRCPCTIGNRVRVEARRHMVD